MPVSDIKLANMRSDHVSDHNDNVLDNDELPEDGSLSPILDIDSEQHIEEVVDAVAGAVDYRLDIIPDIKVECEYTLLSDDCMRPSSQLIVFRANDSIAVRRYLEKEPLSMHGGVTPWVLYEMRLEKDNIKDDDDEENMMTSAFTADLYDPYVFLTLSTTDDQVKKLELDPLRQQILDDSLDYHLKAANDYAADPPSTATTAPYISTYGNMSRVVTLGRLHHVSDGVVSSDSSNSIIQQHHHQQGPIAGQLLLFNARSRADALRYLSRDPLSCSVETLNRNSPQVAVSSSSMAASSSLMDASSSSMATDMESVAVFQEMTLSAANLLDVSGLHHMMGRTFAQKWQLDKVGRWISSLTYDDDDDDDSYGVVDDSNSINSYCR